MIVFLLNVYLLGVWLVFIRFKLLPFDLKAKISVGVIGGVGILGLLILINFLHPQSLDARVIQQVTQVASRTSQPARVTKVSVEPNQPVKQDDVLFELDSRTSKAEVARLEAALAEAEQNVPQLQAAYDAALAAVEKAKGQLAEAASENERNRTLFGKTALSQEDFEKSTRNLEIAKGTLKQMSAEAEKARLAAEAKTASGENVDVAQLKAELTKARIDVEEATVRAPADGYVTNLQLRPGFIVRPSEPVLTFVVAATGTVVVTLPQEYLPAIEVGNEVEVCLDMYPGKTLHGQVETIILASGAGQLTPTGELPTASAVQSAVRFPIKVKLDPADAERYRPPGGAHGAAAIYTNYGRSLKIVRRVTLRWYTWLNYVKLAM